MRKEYKHFRVWFIKTTAYKLQLVLMKLMEVINATGSFEGVAITRISISGSRWVEVMASLIKIIVGTNALNGDIVLKFSADNGYNNSTATLTAMDFATGIKMAKVNDLSVYCWYTIKI